MEFSMKKKKMEDLLNRKIGRTSSAPEILKKPKISPNLISPNEETNDTAFYGAKTTNELFISPQFQIMESPSLARFSNMIDENPNEENVQKLINYKKNKESYEMKFKKYLMPINNKHNKFDSVEIYENQSWTFMKGWAYQIGEKPNWTYLDGREIKDMMVIDNLQYPLKWIGEWSIFIDQHFTDSQGWQVK